MIKDNEFLKEIGQFNLNNSKDNKTEVDWIKFNLQNKNKVNYLQIIVNFLKQSDL